MNKQDIGRTLGRIEGQMDSLITDVRDLRDMVEDKTESLAKRVGKLENKQYGIVLLGSTIFATAAAVFKKFWS